MKRVLTITLAALLIVTMAACTSPAATPISTVEPVLASAASPEPTATPESEATPESTPTPAPMPMPDMTVESEGIMEGVMGLAYGAKGEQFAKSNIPSRSLPLTVSFVPEGTVALALTMTDPDGGNWVHWLACDIPVAGATVDIPENASIDYAEQIVQGKNDFGPSGYGGPTPPSGVHTYVITVYALSSTLALDDGFRLADLTAAMEGKVLAEAIITGTYAR